MSASRGPVTGTGPGNQRPGAYNRAPAAGHDHRVQAALASVCPWWPGASDRGRRYFFFRRLGGAAP